VGARPALKEAIGDPGKRWPQSAMLVRRKEVYGRLWIYLEARDKIH
jgi:hypothetical protein